METGTGFEEIEEDPTITDIKLKIGLPREIHLVYTKGTDYDLDLL